MLHFCAFLERARRSKSCLDREAFKLYCGQVLIYLRK